MRFRITVIVPTLNDSTLHRTLEAVTRQTRPPDEFIVVGRDEFKTTRSFPSVTFIDTHRPVCAAAARNRAIEASIGDVLVFTDSDCIPDDDWLAQHERLQATGQQVIGGGVELAGESYWAQGDNAAMFHEFIVGRKTTTKRSLPTLNLSVHRRVIDDVGLMDESFPGAASEDTDWTVRMRLAGHELRFEPAAVVSHAPARKDLRSVVQHWRRMGYSSIRVRHRYADYFDTPVLARSAPLMRLMSPAIAAYVTTKIYSQAARHMKFRYLPLVFGSKLLYCWGAAQAIDSGFAFQE